MGKVIVEPTKVGHKVELQEPGALRRRIFHRAESDLPEIVFLSVVVPDPLFRQRIHPVSKSLYVRTERGRWITTDPKATDQFFEEGSVEYEACEALYKVN